MQHVPSFATLGLARNEKSASSSNEITTMRRRILDASQAMIRQRGVANFSIQALATQSGIARRTIYNQFEDREGLISATIHDLLERAELCLEKKFTPGPSIEQTLRAICTTTTEMLCSKELIELRQIIAGSDEESAAIQAMYDRRVRTAIRFAMEDSFFDLVARWLPAQFDIRAFCVDFIRLLETNAQSSCADGKTVLTTEELTQLAHARLFSDSVTR